MICNDCASRGHAPPPRIGALHPHDHFCDACGIAILRMRAPGLRPVPHPPMPLPRPAVCLGDARDPEVTWTSAPLASGILVACAECEMSRWLPVKPFPSGYPRGSLYAVRNVFIRCAVQRYQIAARGHAPALKLLRVWLSGGPPQGALMNL